MYVKQIEVYTNDITYTLFIVWSKVESRNIYRQTFKPIDVLLSKNQALH